MVQTRPAPTNPGNPQSRSARKKGAHATPGVIIADAQSAKSAEGGEGIGFDGNKKVKGRKRQLIADTLGLVWGVYVHSAQEHDSKSLGPVLTEALRTLPAIWKVYLDRGYLGDAVAQIQDCHVEAIVPEPRKSGAFTPESQRWVVERTIAWLSRLRRLTRDFERTLRASENWCRIGGMYLALRKLRKDANP